MSNTLSYMSSSTIPIILKSYSIYFPSSLFTFVSIPDSLLISDSISLRLPSLLLISLSIYSHSNYICCFISAKDSPNYYRSFDRLSINFPLCFISYNYSLSLCLRLSAYYTFGLFSLTAKLILELPYCKPSELIDCLENGLCPKQTECLLVFCVRLVHEVPALD